ncbi:hypothetical protein TNCV_1937951 [Trichonephila clavipes]|nr:hypothetical protein TNCV_1937951 [Trichonephila clavipes]
MYDISGEQRIVKIDIAIVSDRGILTSHCSATQGLLATNHESMKHGQVTWTTPSSPNYHTPPTGGHFSS